MVNEALAQDQKIALIQVLLNNGLQEISQTALQTILERTVSQSRRELDGQFTTPAALAELLVRITVRDWIGDVLDPCCGTGSIPKAVLNCKRAVTNDILQSIKTTWASDKYSFPLQIANISLTSVDSMNIPNNIFKQNALRLTVGDEIRIVNPENGETLNIKLPEFGAIVSNFPFVPFEVISNEDLDYINNIISAVYKDTNIELDRRTESLYPIIAFSIYKTAKSRLSGVIIKMVTKKRL